MRSVLVPTWLLLFNFIYTVSFSSSIITFLVGLYILESVNTEALLYTFSIKYNKDSGQKYIALKLTCWDYLKD